MIENNFVVATGAGAMNVFGCRPERFSPSPTIIFYMDAPGIREELRDMARRLATVGYSVFLPDLYYRTPGYDPIDCTKLHLDGLDRARLLAMMKTISTEGVMQDTAALIDFLRPWSWSTPDRIGLLGYCMSGPFVVTATARFAERVVATASIYGINLVTSQPDSPHLLLPEIRGELYFACGEKDQFSPPESIAKLREALQKTKIQHEVEVYPGADHAFAFPLRHAYDKASAERHWERLFALFKRTL